MSSRSAGRTSTLLLILTINFFYSVSVSANTGVEESRRSTVNSNAGTTWNLIDSKEPLLAVADSQPDLDSSFVFPFGQAGIHLTQSLHYNSQTQRYLLMLVADKGRRGSFLELRRIGSSQTFATIRGPRVEIVDQGTIKVLRTPEGQQYSFINGPDGALRCIQIQDRTGAQIRLTYNADGLILGMADNRGRTIAVNYANNHISGVVQTWNVDAVRMVKSWNQQSVVKTVGLDYLPVAEKPRFGVAKSMPINAVTTNYTKRMAECDQMLARIFGGPGAVAAANSFEPAGLSRQYPIYRGDLRGSDGILRPGHLSYAMHLYGSGDGTEVTPLYVPAGFTMHSNTPTPSDAAITFYYPRLGNLMNITLAVFHVDDFAIREENGRIRIGNIGGRGGSFQLYRHSHIEFYRGNTGLPASNRRQSLRINPATVFEAGYDSVRLRTVAQR